MLGELLVAPQGSESVLELQSLTVEFVIRVLEGASCYRYSSEEDTFSGSW